MPIDLYCGCGRALLDYRERITGECHGCLDSKATTKPSYAPAAVQVRDDEDVEEEESSEGQVDPVTRRLIDDALKTHGKAECPKCWHRGKFIRMALVCPKHGVFAGA